MRENYCTMLSIAGSDPIGGAGIQADIKTATSLGVYAMTAITAVTAQNTRGVTGYISVGAKMLEMQLNTIVDDVMPDVVKIGMIPDADTAEIIADFLDRNEFKAIVVDPVMVSTSGHSLSGNDTLAILTHSIIPKASIVTPNIPEAKVLSRRDITSLQDMVDSANDIIDRYRCPSVLLKGGHYESDGVMTDILVSSVDGRKVTTSFTHPAVDTPNTHGTGCTLSSAIASHIAMGYNETEAVSRAIQYLTTAIKSGSKYSFGHGHGPVNFMHNIKK